MTDLALDLQNAAAAMGTHDAMIAVIADVRAVLPRFIVPPTTRVLHGADEDGEPFLSIALPDRRVSFYPDAGRIGWHTIVRGEFDASGAPGEREPVHFGTYSPGALPDILSLLFDEAPLCILATQTMGAHGSLRFTDRPADPGDLQPQARLCRAAWELLDLGLEGDDNVLDCFRRNQIEFWEGPVRVFPLPDQEPA